MSYKATRNKVLLFQESAKEPPVMIIGTNKMTARGPDYLCDLYVYEV